MTTTMSSQSPIAIAERLLEVVRSTFQPVSNNNLEELQHVYEMKDCVVTLCDELKRVVTDPLEYTITLAESCQESSALRFVTELSVSDIIKDDNVSLVELSRRTGVDSRYLHTAMNCLLVHGYFDEIEDSLGLSYRNNDMSRILSSDNGTIKDAVGFICDEGLKSTSYLLEAAKVNKDRDNGTEPEGGKNVTAAQVAFGFQGSIFEWMASPGQVWRTERMGKAMQQLHGMANGNIIVDFKWNDLPSPVVDIGGGIGALEMAILKLYPEYQLDFVIFDIPETVEAAKKVWKSQTASNHTRVSFVPGDFLAPATERTHIPEGQPTYLIRHVLHDWTDEQVVAILRNVRKAMLSGLAAGSNTPKLLLCEMLLRKKSSRFVRTTSMQLLALNNGVTRTEKDMIRLLMKAGFIIRRVHNMRTVDSIIEATPSADS